MILILISDSDPNQWFCSSRSLILFLSINDSDPGQWYWFWSVILILIVISDLDHDPDPNLDSGINPKKGPQGRIWRILAAA